MATREFDAIDEGTATHALPQERSAVESLASLVHRLIFAYLWFWILIVGLGFVVAAIKYVF